MRAVLQVLPALESGGVERTTIEIVEALRARGDRALVASRGGRLEPDLTAHGGEFFPLPLATKNPLEIWANAARLADLARRERVSLIHARSRAPAWSALWAARRLKLPFVTTYHGIYKARSAPKRFYNSVMARGDLVIANSFFTRAHVLAEHKLDPARVIAIPRGVDLAAFDPAKIDPARVAALRAAWRIEDDAPVFVLAGRISRIKGHALAIEAAAEILRAAPAALTLVFAGDAQGRDDLVAELEAEIACAGAAGRIRFVGHVADMPAAYAAADAALFPTIVPEAFGRAAVEAQAMGLPVIGADHGGFTETIVPGETGFLVAPGAAAPLRAALETLISMGKAGRAAMGAKAMARARRLYATSALQEATLGVYDRLLGAEK